MILVVMRALFAPGAVKVKSVVTLMICVRSNTKTTKRKVSIMIKNIIMILQAASILLVYLISFSFFFGASIISYSSS